MRFPAPAWMMSLSQIEIPLKQGFELSTCGSTSFELPQVRAWNPTPSKAHCLNLRIDRRSALGFDRIRCLQFKHNCESHSVPPNLTVIYDDT